MTLPPRTTGLIVLGVLAYVMVAGPGAMLLTRLVASSPVPTALVPITTMLLGETLLAGVLLLVVATRGWWRLSSLAPDQPLRLGVREWRAALVLPLALLLVMVGRVAAGLSSGPGQTLLTHTAPATIVLLIVSTMLLVGFNEELLFRGLALGALLRDRGRTRREVYQAVITVGVLFGLAHLIRQGPIATKLELAAGTAAIGLVFAGLWLATGSIWLGVLLHGLGDSIQLVGALSLGYFASSAAHGPPSGCRRSGYRSPSSPGSQASNATSTNTHPSSATTSPDHPHDHLKPPTPCLSQPPRTTRRPRQGAARPDDPTDRHAPTARRRPTGPRRPVPLPGPGGVDPSRRVRGRLVSGQDLTAAEVADLFRVTEQTVQEWARDDKLPYQ